MKHYRFFLSASALMILVVLVLGVIGTHSSASYPGAGQEAARDRDLARAFAKFQIVKLGAGEAARQVTQQQQLTLMMPDRTLTLVLHPNDMRAPNYRSTETGAAGLRELAAGPVITFKGNIAGHADSPARFTIDGQAVEGLIVEGDREYFVESARKYSGAATEDDLVFYERGDVLAPAKMVCLTDSEKVASVAKHVDLPTPQAATFRVVELATEADFEYTTAHGGTAATANNAILGIMNMVEVTYEHDLNMKFTITFQHAWTTADPFTGADASTFLDSFKGYWNNTFSTVLRDTAHLWTGKAQFGGVGRAFQGVVCRSPVSSYGFNGIVGQFPQEFILAAHELGHPFGATHPDQEVPPHNECVETVMESSIDFTNTGHFCQFSLDQINTYIAANSTCISTQSSSRNRFDFDGDGKTDDVVFRPTDGSWYRINSGNGQFIPLQFGQQGDRPVPEDYDGDGKADIAVFRPSNGGWYLLASSTGAFSGVAFGVNSDLPAPADFDGDGKADIAVYRPAEGTWYMLLSSNGTFRAVNFGVREDIPVPADYDGDGKADVAVFRPSTGSWYRLNSSDGSFHGTQFGASGDKPVPADFDGDGKADIAVFRPSNGGWYIVNSQNGSVTSTAFGISTDRPLASDFDGDGKADIAVFRSDGGNWFELLSASNNFAAQSFGSPGDLPAPAAYVP